MKKELCVVVYAFNPRTRESESDICEFKASLVYVKKRVRVCSAWNFGSGDHPSGSERTVRSGTQYKITDCQRQKMLSE